MAAEPAALVMADAPRAGACLRGLEGMLGPEGCARLQAVLVARAAAWALTTAPGRAFVAFGPADARAEVAPLVPADGVLFAQAGGHAGERLATAVEEVFERAPGPLLVVGTGVARLGPGHAAAALADLADGCDATFGPALAGGFYFVGLAAPHAEVLMLDAQAWAGPRLFPAVIERAHGLELGLLRYERALDEPLDVRALLADPLAPRDVVAALGARRP